MMEKTTAAGDLIRRIIEGTDRARRLTGKTLQEALQSQDLEAFSPPRGEKSIPKRKRRYHLNAVHRAEKRWEGAQKMLKLLEPAGVRSDARAMDALTRKYGI